MRIKILFLIIGLFVFEVKAQTSIGDIYGTSFNNYFGNSLALNANGNRLVVGSSSAGGNNGTGEVKVFERNGNTWNLLGSAIYGSVNNFLGKSVAISADGSRIVAGAPGNNFSRGLIGVYEYSGGTWNLLGDYMVGEVNNDFFGTSVSISADGTKVVSGGVTGSGYAKVFSFNGSSWEQIGQKIEGESSNDHFGEQVSLSSNGTVLAVGARINGANGYGTGHVRVFENIGGNWTQIGSDIDGEAEQDQFSYAMKLSGNGNRIVVSAPFNDSNGADAGEVKVFERSNDSWVQIGQSLEGQNAGDRYGINVAINTDGTVITISSINNDNNGTNAGQIKVFKEITTNNWSQVGNDIYGIQFDHFGIGLAISSDGNTLAGGAIYHNPYMGIVRTYDLTSTLGINSFNLSKQVIMYPNPVTDILYIHNLENILFTEYSILDINGRVLINKSKIQSSTINVSRLREGTYFVHLKTNEGIIVKKIIKQ